MLVKRRSTVSPLFPHTPYRRVQWSRWLLLPSLHVTPMLLPCRTPPRFLLHAVALPPRPVVALGLRAVVPRHLGSPFLRRIAAEAALRLLACDVRLMPSPYVSLRLSQVIGLASLRRLPRRRHEPCAASASPPRADALIPRAVVPGHRSPPFAVCVRSPRERPPRPVRRHPCSLGSDEVRCQQFETLLNPTSPAWFEFEANRLERKDNRNSCRCQGAQHGSHGPASPVPRPEAPTIAPIMLCSPGVLAWAPACFLSSSARKRLAIVLAGSAADGAVTVGRDNGAGERDRGRSV